MPFNSISFLMRIQVPAETGYSLVLRLKMASENLGITFVSSSAMQVCSASDLCYVPLETPFEPWSAKIYWRKDRALTEEEQKFREFACRLYGSLH